MFGLKGAGDLEEEQSCGDGGSTSFGFGNGLQRLRQALVGGVSLYPTSGSGSGLGSSLALSELFAPSSLGHSSSQRPRSGSPEGQLHACQLSGAGLALRKDAGNLGLLGGQRAGLAPLLGLSVCLSSQGSGLPGVFPKR